MPSLGCLVILLFVVGLVRGHNVSVDDTSLDITYSPEDQWETSPVPTNLDFPFADTSSHHLVDAQAFPGANAVFSFTGVAVYYFSPLWPYQVNVSISLNGETSTCVDLWDHSTSHIGGRGADETVASAPMWYKVGLTNTEHTITVSACENAQILVVDGFVYSVPDVTSSASALAPTTSATRAASSAVSPGSRTHTIYVAVGAAFAGLCLLSFLVYWSCFRRSRRRRSLYQIIDLADDDWDPVPWTSQHPPPYPGEFSSTASGPSAQESPQSQSGWRFSPQR